MSLHVIALTGLQCNAKFASYQSMLLYAANVHAGISGFSMGGVHACMVASLYPNPIACVPLLAPRSASVAFCHGALREATAWQPLLAAADEANKASPLCSSFLQVCYSSRADVFARKSNFFQVSSCKQL